ncbi:BA75_02286T0 [Komagataella pastoris]|uniref:BA75_02286T0 n=1 Tax=Komagataella pastoris TaxID=4922 RepID=A0A1B2JD11_PICPA|nr:BA75_02286T0 [Komagataella pastoris]
MYSQGDQLIRQLRIYDSTAGELEQYEEPQDEFTSLKILDRCPEFVPPINFAIVEDGIYRSGHPQAFNFPYLQKLNLKTIIYLGDKTDNYDYYRWLRDQGINFHYLNMQSCVEPFMFKDDSVIQQALKLIVHKENYPMLIHSNKGKHRVGVLVGIMRKLLQGWCISGIFDEYGRFAGGKGEGDVEYIETFKTDLLIDKKTKPEFVRVG